MSSRIADCGVAAVIVVLCVCCVQSPRIGDQSTSATVTPASGTPAGGTAH